MFDSLVPTIQCEIIILVIVYVIKCLSQQQINLIVTCPQVEIQHRAPDHDTGLDSPSVRILRPPQSNEPDRCHQLREHLRKTTRVS
ncbi:Glutamyl-tRNA(Gln) amidotransferase subunit A [Fusarium oxysporum f. sp. albedinis]|nr:Glutamyl-tRNA(Gln) amidotransferase subunit A [Fusarium oxysporum f. sp. albedinis]